MTNLRAESLSTNAQHEGCFDERRFCFLLSEKNDASGSYIISVQRYIDLPLALTLYSEDLGHQAHANAFLATNNPIVLGETTSPLLFWSNMRVKWTVGDIDASHDNDFRYLSPLQPHQNYPIVQGVNGSFSHSGASRYALDFGAKEGTPVLAARGGVVIDTKSTGKKGGPTADFAKYANYVAILHDDGTTGEYYHLKYNGVTVSREQRVAQGQLIGYTGNTGFSSLPHLHFGVYIAKFHGRYQSVPFTLNTHNP
ncbi:M23 family metallopeptidase [Alteromonas sp. A081]|uniref:M23 family metallopeptidase n=1 Tax=Alteromonas sp. A081 TaxID=3410269 RepID=UPI003B98457B